MKNKGLVIVSTLSLIIALAAIQILPGQIPVHFGLNGEADRIGSKYEVFIFAAEIIVVSVIGILLRRKFERDSKNAADEKTASHAAGNARICVVVCTAQNAVMLGIEVIFIAIGYNGLQDLQGSSGELYCSVMCVLFGILFTVLGNILPKVRMNGLIGLRTTWSMKNEEVWARSQRMGGTLMFFGGAATIISGIVLRGFPSIIVSAIIITVIVAAAVKGSHQIYIDWEKENNNE